MDRSIDYTGQIQASQEYSENYDILYQHVTGKFSAAAFFVLQLKSSMAEGNEMSSKRELFTSLSEAKNLKSSPEAGTDKGIFVDEHNGVNYGILNNSYLALQSVVLERYDPQEVNDVGIAAIKNHIYLQNSIFCNSLLVIIANGIDRVLGNDQLVEYLRSLSLISITEIKNRKISKNEAATEEKAYAFESRITMNESNLLVKQNNPVVKNTIDVLFLILPKKSKQLVCDLWVLKGFCPHFGTKYLIKSNTMVKMNETSVSNVISYMERHPKVTAIYGKTDINPKGLFGRMIWFEQKLIQSLMQPFWSFTQSLNAHQHLNCYRCLNISKVVDDFLKYQKDSEDEYWLDSIFYAQNEGFLLNRHILYQSNSSFKGKCMNYGHFVEYNSTVSGSLDIGTGLEEYVRSPLVTHDWLLMVYIMNLPKSVFLREIKA